MARYNQKDLSNRAELFYKLAYLIRLGQGVDDEEEEDDEELMREFKAWKARRKQQQAMPQLKQRSPGSKSNSQTNAPAPKTTEQIITYDGLGKEIYSEIAPAGQFLKGKFNQNFYNEITKIFNEELFYHATIGRSDRDQMRKFVSNSRARMAITVTAATNSNSAVTVQFWSTDPSFRSKYPNQTAAAEKKLSQLLAAPIYNTIQTIAQTSGLTEPTKAPIVINTYFSVVDNDDEAVYSQL